MRQRAWGRGVSWVWVASVATLLAGCASKPTAQTVDDSACRQEAYNDPQVKALFNQANPWNDRTVFDFSYTTPREDAQYAYRQAVLACMQRRGLISGGVEPVRKYPFGPLGF